MKHRFLTTTAVMATSMLVLGACSGGGAGGAGDAWPEGETITIVVPQGAGGASDVTARVLARCFEEEVGGTWIVENEETAAGVRAMTRLASADPDGTTFALATQSNVVTTPLLVAPDAGYGIDSFDYIGQVLTYPGLLVVQANSRFENMEQFLDEARANPQSISVATTGAQTSFHIVLSKQFPDKGIQLNVAPFPGDAAATTALLGGQVDAKFAGLNSQTLEYVDSGELRALASSSVGEIPEVVQDLPTFESSGLDGLLSTYTSQVFMAPAGLPAEVTDSLVPALESCTLGEQMAQTWSFQVAYEDGEAVRKEFEDYDVRLRELFPNG